MKKITLSFELLAAIIVVTILQACAGAAGMAGTAAMTTTQCAKPTLSPPGVSGPVHSVTVTIATATTGAYLRYTLDGSTPTGGSSGHGSRILASSGKVTFPIGHKTLKAIGYKAGWTTSLIAVGNYDYDSTK